jgi:hypothetical protein
MNFPFPIRIGIVGSRSFADAALLASVMEDYTRYNALPNLIVSGGARGADTLALAWATAQGIPTLVLPPDTARFGKRAFFIRNCAIVRYSTLLIAFWDGESKGTKFTLAEAKRQGVQAMVVRV